MFNIFCKQQFCRHCTEYSVTAASCTICWTFRTSALLPRECILLCVSYERHSKQRFYLQTALNYLFFETEKCVCFEVGNNFKYNPEEDISTSVVGFWSLVFGPISRESWFDSWPRLKVFFFLKTSTPVLEPLRLHIHCAPGTLSSGGTVDHLNLELRSKENGCNSTSTYAFLAHTVKTLPLLYCPNQECVLIKTIISPQSQTHQPVHSLHVCVQSSDINPTKALVHDFQMGASPNGRKASGYRELIHSWDLQCTVFTSQLFVLYERTY